MVITQGLWVNLAIWKAFRTNSVYCLHHHQDCLYPHHPKMLGNTNISIGHCKHFLREQPPKSLSLPTSLASTSMIQFCMIN